MFNQVDMTKLTQATLSLARFWIETGSKNLGVFQEQTNKAMDSAISAVDRLQEETRSAYEEWRKASDRACRAYTETLENGLVILSSALGQPGGASSAKSKKETQ